MRMKTLGFLVVFACALLPWASIAADPPDEPKPPRVAMQIEYLAAQDFARRTAAAQQIKKGYQELVAELVTLVDKGDKALAMEGSTELAVNLLGDLRAIDAVPILIKNIEFRGPGGQLENIRAAQYPCVRALAKIGAPSIKGIIERLGQGVTEKELRLFATICRLVDNDELAIARIQLALNKESFPPRKENLEKLLKLLKDTSWNI